MHAPFHLLPWSSIEEKFRVNPALRTSQILLNSTDRGWKQYAYEVQGNTLRSAHNMMSGQTTSSRPYRNHYDIIVVGSGGAGLTAALPAHVSSRNLRILIVDPRNERTKLIWRLIQPNNSTMTCSVGRKFAATKSWVLYLWAIILGPYNDSSATEIWSGGLASIVRRTR